jgi:hypothetical protein
MLFVPQGLDGVESQRHCGLARSRKKSPVASDTLNEITTEFTVTGALNVPVTVKTMGKNTAE